MTLSKLEQKARRARGKEFSAALRRLRVGTSWRFSSHFLFQQRSGWFVSVTPSVAISKEKTTARIDIKPMELDPIFWKIIGLEENNGMPMSFRRNGAWTCSTPAYREIELSENSDMESLACRLIEWSDQVILDIDKLNIDDFINFIQVSERGYPDAFFSAEISGLILQGNLKNALEICREAKARNSDGGFVWGPPGARTSLVDAAEDWLARSQN